MTEKIRNASFECAEILCIELFFVKSAVHLERTNRCNDNDRIGSKSCHSALYIEELFCAEISAEACLGDSIIAHFKRHFCRHYGVTAVCNVCKRSAVNKCGCALKRLNKVRLDCVLEKCRHSALSLELTAGHGLVIICIADNDL